MVSVRMRKSEYRKKHWNREGQSERKPKAERERDATIRSRILRMKPTLGQRSELIADVGNGHTKEVAHSLKCNSEYGDLDILAGVTEDAQDYEIGNKGCDPGNDKVDVIAPTTGSPPIR